MEYLEVPWSDSACKNMDLNTFFPEPGRNYPTKVLEAKAVCGGCPIKQDCLAYAMEHETHGIWGGKTASERQGIYRNLVLSATLPVRDPSRRLKNLAIANEQRAIQASSESILKLSQALESVGNQAMPDWIEAARLRINNPSKSLAELAAMSNQSKDAYSGKLRRLLALSNQPK